MTQMENALRLAASKANNKSILNMLDSKLTSKENEHTKTKNQSTNKKEPVSIIPETTL